MKPVYEALKVEGQLPNAGRRMTIDAAIAGRILIDMYSDKELAVIRELSTNAHDSHLAAGNIAPIEVITPSPLSPYFVVRDHGVGLSKDEVDALFGEYGASTKRDSDLFNGTLGIGSKAPLTYSSQFTMTATKDGTRTVVAITRDEDGVGRVTPVHESPTEDPNGVEIKIPAKQANALAAKAANFFQYWQPGTVLLDGQDPTGLPEDTMTVTDSIRLRKNVGQAPSVIVMGNVAYPAPELSYAHLGIPPGHNIVAHVPMGAVDFAPARESLAECKLTRDTIVRITKDFKDGLHRAIQSEIDAQPTGHLAMRTMRAWRTLYDRGNQMPDFTYKGVTIPRSFNVPSSKTKDRYGYETATPTQRQFLTDGHEAYTRRRSRGVVQHMPSINLDTLMNSIFVLDLSNHEITPTIRKKAVQWRGKQDGLSSAVEGAPRYFAWLDYEPDALRDFVPAERIVSFDTIKAEVLPKPEGGASGRIPGSFDIVLGGPGNEINGYKNRTAEGTPGSDIDQNYPVFYCHGNLQDGRHQFCVGLGHFHDKFTLICLPENRLAKFERENPKIKNARDEIKRLAEQAIAKISQDQRDAYAQHEERDRATWATLKGSESRFDDPAIKEAIRLAQVDVSHLDTAKKFYGWFQVPNGNWIDPLDNYPLVPYGSYLREHLDHAVIYMNAVYAARKDTP